MVNQIKQLYEFGVFSLDPDERLLLRAGKPVSLTPKAFDLLLLFVENKGRLLEKEDLMQALWQDSFVEEGNLSFNVSILRKALGENPKQRQYIETVSRRGYRFIADVRILERETNNRQGIAEKAVTETVSEKEAKQFADETTKIELEESNSGNLSFPAKKAVDGNVEKPTLASHSRFARRAINGSRHRNLFVPLVVLIAAAIICFAVYKFTWQSSDAAPSAVSQPMKVVRLTTARNTINAAISPDGKYAVYVTDEARRRSLWLRQIATGSDTPLIAPEDVNYLDIAFSPDGSYVNYVKAEPDRKPALFQIPLLGGSPRKLIEDVSSPWISPDGRKFVFMRRSADGEVTLSAANIADGGEEEKLIVRKQPGFLHDPVWSPDGKTIVCVAGNITDSGRRVDLIEVRLADKTERTIISGQWKFVGSLAWLPDASGLLATAADYSFGPYQVWHVSHPDGKARRVTNDLSNYAGISLTADSKTLVTVQSDIRPFVWVSPGATAANARQITSSPGTRNDYWGFSWTPDGKIVFVSTAGGSQDIWIMNSDGSDRKQLTFGEHSDFDPAVSPDGRHIVFASERSGNTKIWRMDISGENLEQLTRGETSDYLPYYAPDGQTVVYTSSDTRSQTLWKLALEENSAPVQLTRYNASWGAVSPDGSLIALWRQDEKTGAVNPAVISIEGGEPIKSFSVSPTTKTWADIRWTADGRGLTYIDTTGGVGNLWFQPMDGGAPRQLTDFKTERIFRFAWSPDGRQLTFSRGIETNDVVLISDFR